MSRTGTNDGSNVYDNLDDCFPRVIYESAFLEAFYPPLPYTDDMYDAVKDSARARAFKRLSQCMVDGSTYSVMRLEEFRAATNNPDLLGVFVVTLTYIANIDTLLT